MQKVLRRSQTAKRLAIQKTKEHQQGKERADLKRYNDTVRRIQRNVAHNIQEVRKNRRSDWEAGVLAPRHDVGDKAETYGTVSLYDFQKPDLLPKDRIKWWPVDVGDRVVMTKGRDRGKIGVVTEIQKDKGAVVVKDMNPIDIWVPEWMRQENDNDQAIVTQPLSQPIEHVKLVYPLPDPETGMLRDVVIDEVVPHGKSRDRLVLGSNIIIPAQPQPLKEEDEETYPVDTPTMSVDEETFNPPLLFPPMPTSVIDELRNKYSMHRTRHDYEYLEKKREEDEREEKRKGLGKTMRTPLQELAELRARQKKAQERVLTDEQLAKIGEIIAREKTRSSSASIASPTEKNVQIDNTL